MGVGRLIKEIFPEALVIGVQPEGCEVLKGKAIPHKIEGLAVGFLSSFLDTKIIDKVLSVSSSEAISYMRCLARSEGLFVGVSSAANICAAVRVAKELGEGKKVITIAPDTGRNYSHLYA